MKIVFNRAEMTIYSVYCSRNLGCLCRVARGGSHPLTEPTGTDCYAPLEPIGKEHFQLHRKLSRSILRTAADGGFMYEFRSHVGLRSTSICRLKLAGYKKGVIVETHVTCF